jgi:hypothetical protein
MKYLWHEDSANQKHDKDDVGGGGSGNGGGGGGGMVAERLHESMDLYVDKA